MSFESTKVIIDGALAARTQLKTTAAANEQRLTAIDSEITTAIDSGNAGKAADLSHLTSEKVIVEAKAARYAEQLKQDVLTGDTLASAVTTYNGEAAAINKPYATQIVTLMNSLLGLLDDIEESYADAGFWREQITRNSSEVSRRGLDLLSDFDLVNPRWKYRKTFMDIKSDMEAHLATYENYITAE